MRRIGDLLVDGLLLALPLVATVLLLRKVVGVLTHLLALVSNRLPEDRWFGIAPLELEAIGVLLIALIGLGAVARTRAGRRTTRTLENVMLNKIPGYMIMKSMASDLSTSESGKGLRPVLVDFDTNAILGFIVEGNSTTEMLTVFVPGAPSAASGSVMLVPRARVRTLDVSTSSAMRAMKQRGLGLQQLAERKSQLQPS